MPKINVNGINVCYDEAGEGDKVAVFLHGNGESKSIFARFKDVCPNVKKYFLDTRGHGGTDYAEPFDFSAFSEDVYAFLQAKNVKKAIIFGYSDGANTATYLCKQHPEVIEKLILVSGNIYRKGLNYSFLIPCFLFTCLIFPLRFVKRLNRRYKLNMLMLKDIGVTEDDLEAFNVDALILHAEKDVVNYAHTVLIHLSIKNSALLQINACTHFNIIDAIYERGLLPSLLITD